MYGHGQPPPSTHPQARLMPSSWLYFPCFYSSAGGWLALHTATLTYFNITYIFKNNHTFYSDLPRGHLKKNSNLPNINGVTALVPPFLSGFPTVYGWNTWKWSFRGFANMASSSISQHAPSDKLRGISWSPHLPRGQSFSWHTSWSFRPFKGHRGSRVSRAFLASLYHRFIPATRILLPLNSALGNGNKIFMEWSTQMEDSFEAATTALCRVTSLAHSDPSAAIQPSLWRVRVWFKGLCSTLVSPNW